MKDFSTATLLSNSACDGRHPKEVRVHPRIVFAMKVWHRVFAHAHEIIGALMIEGSKMNLIFFLLFIAALCVAFALQVAFAGAVTGEA